MGRREAADIWLRQNPDMESIDHRQAHRLFLTICQFPAMRASWLREIVGGPSGELSRHLKRFVDIDPVAVFEGRYYLSELGMRRAANMSRVLPSIIRSLQGGLPGPLVPGARGAPQRRGEPADDALRQGGCGAVVGWRGEINVSGLTQVRPDLSVQVSQGTLGVGTNSIEFECQAVHPFQVKHNLGLYRRMAAARRPLPL